MASNFKHLLSCGIIGNNPVVLGYEYHGRLNPAELIFMTWHLKSDPGKRSGGSVQSLPYHVICENRMLR